MKGLVLERIEGGIGVLLLQRERERMIYPPRPPTRHN